MSKEAIDYKKVHQSLDYKKMSIKELNKLPLHNGIVEFKLSKMSFKMLNVLNDDATVVRYFWQGSNDLPSLELWSDISREKGVYIDVGAHTGTYTMSALISNSYNLVVSIEPYYLNMARLVTNLRLNGLEKNVRQMILAASNTNGEKKFNVKTNSSYLSKGGRIDNKGYLVKTIKLDSLNFTNVNEEIKGLKIDTEGEDLKVLQGSVDLINKFKPKIIIEVRNENKIDIQNLLENYNYELFSVNDLKNKINLKKYNINNVINIFANPLKN